MSNVIHMATSQQRLQYATSEAVVAALRVEFERGTPHHLIVAAAPSAIVSGIMSGILTVDRNAPGILTADVINEVEKDTIRDLRAAFRYARSP